MPRSFEERENSFETQFAHDETLRFKAVARRNKAVAMWVAGLKGLSAEAAENYATDFVAAQVGHSEKEIGATLRSELKGFDISDHRLDKKMEDEMAAAIASVKAGR